ncbi:MgtC/SapB family protein [uncultured Paludibaculum sp.]|uniref:MgtC/SapB family protein n=1 Tax=uncultured Paludibaculum sp. TaxID=1765020 RepID=UPI002AAAAF33|nr:MgtC/SapB family protein [uncultured Paludibaculum sp.]
MQHLSPAWIAMAESLLIGLIVGIERESDRDERHAGLRDFIGIGLAGGLCGILNVPWLTCTALLAITTLVAIFRIQTPGRTGITTEIVAVVTFLLCVLTATPGLEWASALAIALTVILALFLDAREPLRRFFVETVTEREYFDTLRFLAVIFVILPVLPDGSYGPYQFFEPRRVWIFVILVCSISYLGYFLQKFLGEEHGLPLTAVLGGLGSTTAATTAFAREAGEEPGRSQSLAMATVLANTVQFPRVAILLWLAGGPLGMACVPLLAAMTVVGLAATWWLKRSIPAVTATANAVKLSNPLRILPAVQFGVLFAVVRLVTRGLTTEFGTTGLLASSAIGGSMDVDAIAFTLSGLLRDGQTAAWLAVAGILISLTANAIFKAAVSYSSGGRVFGIRVLAGFTAMYVTGTVVWLLQW